MWMEILPMTELKPGGSATAHNFFVINNSERWTHLRLNIYPGNVVWFYFLFVHELSGHKINDFEIGHTVQVFRENS